MKIILSAYIALKKLMSLWYFPIIPLEIPPSLMFSHMARDVGYSAWPDLDQLTLESREKATPLVCTVGILKVGGSQMMVKLILQGERNGC